MIGEWFFRKCEFEVIRQENTLKQYFIDNIFGYLIIKKSDYDYICNDNNKTKNNIIIVNRNLSILFLTLFLFSFKNLK